MRVDERTNLFLGSAAACALALIVLWWLGLVGAGWLFGVGTKWLEAFGDWAFVPAGYVSVAVGWYVCRRRGLPLNEPSRETLVRTGTPMPQAMDKPVALSPRRWSLARSGAFLLGVAAWDWAMARDAQPNSWDALVLQLMAVLNAICGLYLLGRCAAHPRLKIEADEDGIARRSLRGRDRRIPWEEIGSCTIETTTTRWLGSTSTAAVCVFRDRSGAKLIRLSLAEMPEDDRRRVLDLIRARQELEAAPAELMSANAPEGTGIEPEAAPAPAGTGTEVEAAAAPVDAGMPIQAARAAVADGTPERTSSRHP